MATPAPNLVNLEKVSKAYGVRPLLPGEPGSAAR